MTIDRSVDEFPSLLRFRCARAHLRSELGREREAREALDELLSHDLAREHVDGEWLFSISILPDVCAFLGDEDAAATVHSLLLPYGDLYAQAPVEAAFGSVARGLGVCAMTLRQFDEAEQRFVAAHATEVAMRARPWQAEALHGLGTALRARAAAGDAERARAVLAEAAQMYESLGMATWAARAAAGARAPA
jgi:tetratricopeptide (TPR) repeat protein